MYTGIISYFMPVTELKHETGLTRFAIESPQELTVDLQRGASVAIDGVCVTAVRITDHSIGFDVMQETLVKTTLDSLQIGRRVNVERSARRNDEVGGHIISGHVTGVATITHIDRPENNHAITFQPPRELMKYIFPKGFIALDGASLTIVDVDHVSGIFTVWFIPETLERTTFGFKDVGDRVNIEIEYQTQVIVDTIERLLPEYLKKNS